MQCWYATANPKKVQRLWREEGLQVPQKRRKRQRLGVADSTLLAARLVAEHPDHVWALDFHFEVRSCVGARLPVRRH